MNVARGVNGNISYDADNIKEKKDYMSMVKELMQLQYDSNNCRVIYHIRNCMIT